MVSKYNGRCNASSNQIWNIRDGMRTIIGAFALWIYPLVNLVNVIGQNFGPWLIARTRKCIYKTLFSSHVCPIPTTVAKEIWKLFLRRGRGWLILKGDELREQRSRKTCLLLATCSPRNHRAVAPRKQAAIRFISSYFHEQGARWKISDSRTRAISLILEEKFVPDVVHPRDIYQRIIEISRMI